VGYFFHLAIISIHPDHMILDFTTRRIKIARFSNGIFSIFSNDKNKNYNTI